MTPLERRSRLLLLAYPAAYRQVRAEEMLDTLLESSPAGRSWPLPRDCTAMIVGGLQVRAAQNRRLSTAANLRLAAMLGCFLYVSYAFTVSTEILWFQGPGMWRQSYSYPSLAWAAGLLACIVVLGVRPGRRKGAIAAMVAVAALIAGTAAAIISDPVAENVANKLGPVVVLAVLALLSHGERLPRVWLWAPGVVVSVIVLGPAAISLFWHDFSPWQPAAISYMWPAIVFLAFAWIAIDARPAVGVAIFLGLGASARLITAWLEVGRVGSQVHEQFRVQIRNSLLAGAWSFAWELLAAALVLVALSAWRLRRQVML
jgi:hypothetical protein